MFVIHLLSKTLPEYLEQQFSAALPVGEGGVGMGGGGDGGGGGGNEGELFEN